MEYFAAVWDDADDNRESASTKLTCPVLAVGGEQAMGRMVEQSAANLAEKVQGVVLPGAGHWLTDERPDEVAALLLEFFSGGREHPKATGDRADREDGET